MVIILIIGTLNPIVTIIEMKIHIIFIALLQDIDNIEIQNKIHLYFIFCIHKMCDFFCVFPLQSFIAAHDADI